MANLDFSRLLKILGLTRSDNDGEALNAIRMVNKLLAEAKLTWAQLIKAPAQVNHAEEVFRAATETAKNRADWVREAYARDLNSDEIRTRQAERDMRYKTFEEADGDHGTGWTTKGPTYWRDGPHIYSEPEPDAAQTEFDADDMASVLLDEQQQANFYVFAVVEPRLARFLFDHRSQGFLVRTLYRAVCEQGDISAAQKIVLRQLMLRRGTES